MTIPITTSTTDSQMHNNIMAVGSRDHPPTLATGRYAQWQSRFLRYIDTRPNGDALRKCILQVETILNMSPENKAHYESEKEAIHLLLTGIGDEIYSTIDACKTAHEMWIAIERLQHAKNVNPLALVATAQPHPDPYYQAPKSHKSYAPTSKASPPTRSHATTRHKGKETAKPITPLSESASEEDSDPEQAQKDKEMQKNLALIAKKPKRVKDSTYHKEKMLLCKQAEKGVPLQAEQSDYFMAKIQEVSAVDSETDIEPLEQVQYNLEYNVFANDRQHFEQPESISNTCVVEKVDSNVIPDSPNM
ncbi:hypothetical protein Tco_1189672, partial [Tanacetum coccineum]